MSKVNAVRISKRNGRRRGSCNTRKMHSYWERNGKKRIGKENAVRISTKRMGKENAVRISKRNGRRRRGSSNTWRQWGKLANSLARKNRLLEFVPEEHALHLSSLDRSEGSPLQWGCVSQSASLEGEASKVRPCHYPSPPAPWNRNGGIRLSFPTTLRISVCHNQCSWCDLFVNLFSKFIFNQIYLLYIYNFMQTLSFLNAFFSERNTYARTSYEYHIYPQAPTAYNCIIIIEFIIIITTTEPYYTTTTPAKIQFPRWWTQRIHYDSTMICTCSFTLFTTTTSSFNPNTFLGRCYTTFFSYFCLKDHNNTVILQQLQQIMYIKPIL